MRIIDTAKLTPESIASMNWQDRNAVYNGLDCCVTLEVLNVIKPQLDNLSSSTYEFSKSLQAPILDMTMRGLRVNQRRRAQVLKEIREDIERLAAQLDTIIEDGIGTSAGWRSPLQMKELFYDVMQLPVQKKRNAKGQMVATVDRDAIEKLSSYFIAEPICLHLLALRELDKKRQFLETKIDADGRIRCNFNIAGTNTGRLASSMSDFGTGGNLQNVDRELREVCVSDPGMKFANLDLEQGDARNVGAICWNTFCSTHGEGYAGSYLDACESEDLHTTVCRMAWAERNWSKTDADHNRRIAEELAYRQDTFRQLAKKLGHGTNYYGLPPTMAKHTKVDRILIEEFQRNYFAAFPVIGSYNKADRKAENWHNSVRQQLTDSASITTLLGRRRYFFGRRNDEETLRGAIAYEPQSMTADEIDRAIIRLWDANRVELLVQVHDNILFQFPEEMEDEILPWAIETCRTEIELAKGRKFVVPVDAKTGWNWGDIVYWTNEDLKKGKCRPEQVGTVKDNPDGLKKWKGGDQRKRSEQPVDGLSIRDL